jgi:hypothetical protein
MHRKLPLTPVRAQLAAALLAGWTSGKAISAD